MTNNKSWNPKTVLDVLIVREGNLLKKFPQTRQLVEKALNDLSAFAANIYNDYLEKKGLTGKKIYPNHYQEEILSVLGEAVMKKFTSRTDRDRILADKVRDLFRAVKGAKDLSFIPHRVALDKITEFHETKLGKQSLDLPVVTDSGLTLKDKLEDSFDPEELIERLDHQKIIAQALSFIDNPAILTDRERQVISMRYLQKKDEVVSLEEIGEELGISRQTAKETEARALKKLSPHLKYLKP